LNPGSEGADNYYSLPCHDALLCGDCSVRVVLSKRVPIINNNSKNAEKVRLKKNMTQLYAIYRENIRVNDTTRLKLKT